MAVGEESCSGCARLLRKSSSAAGTVFIPKQIDDPIVRVGVLLNPDGTGFLRGSAADGTHPCVGLERTFHASPEFHFDPAVAGTPSEQRVHFAESMAYGHVANYDAYVDSLGFGAYDFSTLFPVVRAPGNDFDSTELYSGPGAVVLLVTFGEFIAKLDDSALPRDEFESGHAVGAKATLEPLTIRNGADEVLETLTGPNIPGWREWVLGD